MQIEKHLAHDDERYHMGFIYLLTNLREVISYENVRSKVNDLLNSFVQKTN